jgi:hypothetical protein
LTVTRTLRLDEDLDRALEKMAEEEGESVNVLASRALRRLVEWDRLADDFGMTVVSAQVLTKLMEPNSEEQARELGSWIAKELWEPFITYHYPSPDVASMLEAIRLIAQYGSRFKMDSSVEAGKHVVIIRHAMGTKWSAFYDGLLKSVFSDLLHLDITSHTSKELFTFEFRTPGEPKEKGRSAT